MNYISHLIDDDTMKNLVAQTGMGIESIDFSIAENLDNFEQTMQSYEQRLIYMGNPALTIHGPFLDLNPMAFDSLVQQATMIRYNQAYEAARRLGAKKVIFHSGFIPSVYFLEGWVDRMLDFYNRFLEDKPEEIQILMENVLDPYPEPLREVAEQVQHPAFGICLDVGHANCYSGVPMEQSASENFVYESSSGTSGNGKVSVEHWISVLEPYIRHLHLHDNGGDRDSHMAAGQGNVPWKAVQRLVEQGVEYTLECRTAEDVLESWDMLKGPTDTSR